MINELHDALIITTTTWFLELTTDVTSDVADTTLSTELKPPPPPEKEEHQYMLFVISLYGLKNSSGDTSNEMFENEVIKKVPELTGILALAFICRSEHEWIQRKKADPI